jgi:hypothetical protein
VSKRSYSCHVRKICGVLWVVVPDRAVLIAIALVLAAAPAVAQTIEITPFGGYRVGGSIGEVTAGPVIDDDGGPSVGVVVDVVFGTPTNGLKVEGVFSHEEAELKVRTGSFDPPAYVRAQVDHLLVGGSQDLTDGRARPFLSGLLGITRYAVPGDTEIRFALGVGTGIKFYATPHIGVRLDARGYMTIVNLGGAGVCGGYGCAIRFDVSPAFQADLTAGLLIAF